MAFKFPFTNYHELNLTWVLDQLKALFEKSEENVTTIETYDNRLSAVEAELPVVSETASEASRAAAAAGTLAQTAKTTADTAQNNAIQAQGLAGTARQEAQAAQTAANEATQAAQQAQATAQNFDGRITQAENDASQALEASRSFENRVQSAITTANNANQTATNAQGIAIRADQNAGTALDKIGDLSDLTTEAKQNLVAAINEAAASGGGGGGGGGAVSSVNGKTGAVVLDAGDIDYKSGTVEDELNYFNISDDLISEYIPGTTQTVSFDSNNKPSSIVHSKNGTAYRTDIFTWASESVTEQRTLASGERITISTNLTTLQSVISVISEV